METQDEAALIETMRKDQSDLYAIVDRLRQRVASLDAITIALAWTHPDVTMLLAQLRHWMTLPAEAEMPESIREHKDRESERILAIWTTVIGNSPHSESESVVFH